MKPAAPPDPNLLGAAAIIGRARALQALPPGVEDDRDRLAWLEHKSQRARALFFAALAQLKADIMQVHRVPLDLVARQVHRRADLQKPAHPGLWKVDLDLAVRLIRARLHRKPIGVDR